METELQQAERFAREQQKAWMAGVRWMCEKFAEAPEVVRAAFTPDKGDIVFYCGERIENVAATLYPAPTELEDAGESLGDLDTLEGVKSWMRSFFNGSDQPSADDLIERFEQVLRRDIAQSPNEVAAAYEAGFAFAKAEYENRTTPPQAAPEPGVIVPSRIWLPVKDGKVCINPRDAANFALMADAHAEAYAARNAAERKATEAAREQQKAWVAGVRWMCEKFAEAPEVVRAAFTPDKGDVVFYCGERIENIAATLYPAPTEREAAQECPCGRVRQLCGTVGCSNPAPTERKQYTEGIVLKPTEREATPPQAAPEPLYLVVEYQGPLGDWRGDAYRTRVRLTPEICRRIVAMAGVPVPEEGGR